MSRWKLVTTLTAAALVTLAAAPRASAHCQKQIKALAGKRDAQSANQLTRWVVTKEQHAEKIIRVTADYFLTQKIKPGNPKNKRDWATYAKKLAKHHAVMVAAMKCKQTADPNKVKALSKAIDGIAGYWPKK